MSELLFSNYPRLNGNRLNFVTNPSLASTGISHTSEDLSNQLDRALLRHLRSISDLVITDSATAVAERYKPSKLVDIEVWSRTGNFRSLENFDASPPLHNLRLKQVQNLQAHIDELKSSYTSILFESGPTLTRALADNRVIDELCLTITGSENETVAIKTVEAWAAKFGFTQLKLVQALSVGDAFFTRLVS